MDLKVQLRLAESVATEAHRGQKRKNPKLEFWDREDYINHPRRVSENVETDLEKAVAWLHDVIEDTTVTLDQLLQGLKSRSLLNLSEGQGTLGWLKTAPIGLLVVSNCRKR